MRYDTDHKQRTREKVLVEAARAIRQSGPDKVGVAALMAKAGLTHGGFYAHFSSKDDLIAQAVDYMFEERLALLQHAAAAEDPAAGLSRYIDLYLSPLHRDRRDRGCPVVALSGDVARMPRTARARFEAGFRNMTTTLTGLLQRMNLADADALATTVLLEMIGALTVARALADSGHSDSILEGAKMSVKHRVGL